MRNKDTGLSWGGKSKGLGMWILVPLWRGVNLRIEDTGPSRGGKSKGEELGYWFLYGGGKSEW